MSEPYFIRWRVRLPGHRYINFLFVLLLLGVDPFAYVTIASACMAAYRHKFLVRDTLPYFAHYIDPHTKDSVRWLEFLMWRDTINIAHCRNGGQVTCADILVNGYDEDAKTVYEFHDCKLHGCPTCYPRLSNLLESTNSKMAALHREGYDIEEIWTCEWREVKYVRDSDYKDFEHEIGVAWNEPLNVRDAFYGGRTNAARLYYKCTEAERIDYADFLSLYPSVNKYGEYPGGHPEIILHPDLSRLNSRAYFGVVKCRMVPPRGLLWPVLPFRWSHKLMFALCRTCMEESTNIVCTHEDSERSFVGTWCTPEIYRAMDCGYKCVAVREVHHFSTTVIGAFAEYVNTFLKSKQEASGWPQVKNIAKSKSSQRKALRAQGVAPRRFGSPPV